MYNERNVPLKDDKEPCTMNYCAFKGRQRVMYNELMFL